MSITINQQFFSPESLDWKKRPEFIQNKIDQKFDSVVSYIRWGNDGAPEYNICGIDDKKLLKKVIQLAPHNQKEFYILDVGAGDCTWGDRQAELIDAEQTDLPPDIKVHLFNIGAGNLKNNDNDIEPKYFKNGYYLKNLKNVQIIETKRCIVYNFGTFKIEQLNSEFQRHEVSLENKLDLVISRLCFCHLVDPVGTFVQVFNLLRPKTGVLLMDGFFFHVGEQIFQKRDLNVANDNLYQLLQDTKAPFLMKPIKNVNCLSQFILQRSNDASCNLPMDYSKEKSPFIRFIRNLQQNDGKQLFDSHEEDCLYGDQDLYNIFKSILPINYSFQEIVTTAK